MPRLVYALALSLWCAAAAPAAWAFGDAQRGEAVAKRWCANCHIVSDNAPTVSTDAVPPFLTIARDPRNTPQRLKAFLVDPHPPMPNFNLARQTIEDLIAYFKSLALR